MIRITCQKIIFLFLLITIVFNINSCEKVDYKPSIDDVYVISLNEHSFTTWKITKIEASEIWYVCNDYSVSEKHLVHNINLEKNYTDSPKTISKKAFEQRQKTYLIKKSK